MNAQRPGSEVRAGTFDVSAIAFDLDGTLLDTIHDLAAAVNALLAELGHPPLPKDTIRTLVGKGMPNLVRRALAFATGTLAGGDRGGASSPTRSRATRRITPPASAARRARSRACSRASTRLHAMGFPLAIVTNKATRFVRPHLAQAGIEHFFAVVVGGDDLPDQEAGRRARCCMSRSIFGVPPHRLLMVGDSNNDVAAARAAGCPVLVLPYGYSEGEPVQNLDADGIVASLDAVADRVRYDCFGPRVIFDVHACNDLAAPARRWRAIAWRRWRP